ncbi:YybH family protein [Ideonella sp. BN130291]|uniref:YybH family protein n=1 Tax=Ideonella sp. BN130291 TaxID=3112940 RepID=UPI002E26646F|nr:nuclear transport factor 2 family protein [Ideonella sp. BN130291]
MTLIRRSLLGAAIAAWALAASAQDKPVDTQALRQQVFAAERAFAKTMADRDLKAFASFVAEDTVWFSGPTPLHGRDAVVAFWKRFFEKPQAPFSWEPDQVEVLDSGTLAHSSGPVRDPEGKVFNRFNTVWRQESPGVWRVVFDRGDTPCDCAAKKP